MKIRSFTRIAIGAAIISVLAPIKFIIGPVPFTLSLLGLLIVSFILEPKEGMISVIVYWSLLIIGIPVSASGITGFAAFTSPLSGYLLGYILVPASILLGRKNKTIKEITAVSIVGILGLYMFGIIGLLLVNKDLTFQKAVMIGVVPFILVDSAKVLIAYVIAKRVKKFI